MSRLAGHRPRVDPLAEYAARLDSLGGGAVFALPLQWGSVDLGVLDLYRRAPGSMRHAQLRDLMSAGDIAALMLLGLRTAPVGEDGRESSWVGRAEIHQATGMVTAQLEVSPSDELARLRA